MSIIDHPSEFAPKPRPRLVAEPPQVAKSIDRVRHEALYPPDTGIPYEPGTEPIQSDSEAQLREIAGSMGFKVVSAVEALDSMAPPPEKREPSDLEYVAGNIDRLRHLDLGKMWDEMFGPDMPKDRGEGMQKMAEWAAANKTKGAAP